MNEIVKYHNDLNKLKLPSFTEQEQNLLFTILTKIKNSENRTIRLFRNDLMPEKMESTDYFTSIVNSLKFKFFKATFSYIIETETHIIDRTINLFNTMDIHYQKKNPQDGLDTSQIVECIDFKVNSEFEYLLNALTANFTRFELAEFIALSGKYTKTLYRLLKQYRNTGYLKMEWDEFAMVMDIPSDYSQTNIDKWILKPAIKELTAERNLFDTKRIPFEKLTYTKLKGKGRGRGGNVIGIEFSFKKQVELLTKDEQIAQLKSENAELIQDNFNKNLAISENAELKERIEKLEKIAYGIGLYAYCGLKYYSEKKETLRIIDLQEIKNSSDSNKYKAEILNESSKESFWILLESIKHLLNIISKNEHELALYNQELITQKCEVFIYTLPCILSNP